MMHHRMVNSCDIYGAGIIDSARAPGRGRTVSDDTPHLEQDLGHGSICPVSGVGCPRAAPDRNPNVENPTDDRHQARDR